MEQKTLFIADWESGVYTMTELCAMHGISRKTGYKIVKRYAANGYDGLNELSRAPHTTHPVNAGIIDLCIEVKKKYKSWGPRKVRAYLINKRPKLASELPAASTIGEYFTKAGLVNAKKTRRKTPPYTQPFSPFEKPNDVWSIDYKGDFKLGTGQRCYPLTITDNVSRYLLKTTALTGTKFEPAYEHLKNCFLEHGLPKAILSDNGAPFASKGIGGLSKLSVWLIKLGIRPERIELGHPEQNGRHERMHLTLKNETASPPAYDFSEQQERFDKFKKYYNEDRPHEGIFNRVPAQIYCSSLHCYPKTLGDFEYEGMDIVRRVRTNGQIKWQGGLVFIGCALRGERIGLQEVDDGHYLIYLSDFLIGMLMRGATKCCPVPDEFKKPNEQFDDIE